MARLYASHAHTDKKPQTPQIEADYTSSSRASQTGFITQSKNCAYRLCAYNESNNQNLSTVWKWRSSTSYWKTHFVREFLKREFHVRNWKLANYINVFLDVGCTKCIERFNCFCSSVLWSCWKFCPGDALLWDLCHRLWLWKRNMKAVMSEKCPCISPIKRPLV